MDCVLKDLIAVSKDGEWGKGEAFDDSVEMLAIRGTDFEDVRVGLTGDIPRRHIAKRHAERKLLQPWDVIIEAAGGTKNQITGRTVLLRPQLFARSELPFTCASFSRFIRFNTELCDPAFMFWYLQHLYASGSMHAYHTQHTGVARFQWTTFSEREPLSLPPLRVQRQIAGILSAYDELIENSQRRIKILESMARALYREWFVHFRFPGHESVPFVPSLLGEIPKGWEATTLGDLVEIRKGKNITKDTIRDGSVPVVAGGIAPAYFHDTPNTQRPVITISASGANAGFVNLYYVDVWASDCSFIDLSATPHVYYYYLWLDHRRAAVTHLQRGSAQPHVYPKDLAQLEAIKVPTDLLDAFTSQIEPFFGATMRLAAKVENLRLTRDLLLPRLLSGQIDVEAIAP